MNNEDDFCRFNKSAITCFYIIHLVVYSEQLSKISKKYRNKCKNHTEISPNMLNI